MERTFVPLPGSNPGAYLLVLFWQEKEAGFRVHPVGMSHWEKLSSISVQSPASVEYLLCAELLLGSHNHSASHMGCECLFFILNSSGRGRKNIDVRPEGGKLLGLPPLFPSQLFDPEWDVTGASFSLLALTHLLPYCCRGRRSQAHLLPTGGARSSTPRPRSPRRRWRSVLPCQSLLRCKGQF